MGSVALDITARKHLYRYVMGSVAAVAVAMGFGWQMSFLLPVLALGFLAADAPPSWKEGLSFILTIVAACALGVVLSQFTLPIPLLHILLSSLILFYLFYSNHPLLNANLRVWLMIAVLLIPNIGLMSPALAQSVAGTVVFNATIAMALVALVFAFFPARQKATSSGPVAPGKPLPTKQQRFVAAITRTLVILPLYLLFYYFELTGSILILIFVAILSMQPAFGKDFKVGKALIIGNLIGGIVAIVGFELIVIVPEFGFFLLLTLVVGLILGRQLFSGKPAGALYGMAFSTFLLVVCSVSGSSGNEADSKVWVRVVQIMVAVFYVVTAFGLIERLKRKA